MDEKQASMLHEALDNVLKQADKLDGQLGTISLAVRFDSRVGNHVHASATVRHRIHATVTEKPHLPGFEDSDEY